MGVCRSSCSFPFWVSAGIVPKDLPVESSSHLNFQQTTTITENYSGVVNVKTSNWIKTMGYVNRHEIGLGSEPKLVPVITNPHDD